jgi:hypothetical protein
LSDLIFISALSTFLAIVVFEKCSNNRLKAAATSQLWANLFAMRLFGDEPRIVMQSLWGVCAANIRLLASAVLPILILAPVFYFIYQHFSTAPLSVGVPRVLTVKVLNMDHVRLETPDWIRVDSPPVHIFADKEISWRIRPLRIGKGTMKVFAGSQVIEINSARYLFQPAPPIYFYGVWLNWSWWFAIWSLCFIIPAKILLTLSSTVSKSVRHSISGASGGS